jgi:hypothetical protein
VGAVIAPPARVAVFDRECRVHQQAAQVPSVDGIGPVGCLEKNAMVTARAHFLPLPSLGHSLNATRTQFARLYRDAGAWLHQRLCGLYGHSMVRHFESTKLSLECVSCGHRTPGWDLKAAPC